VGSCAARPSGGVGAYDVTMQAGLIAGMSNLVVDQTNITYPLLTPPTGYFVMDYANVCERK
jgi:hypothetical protein